MKNTIKFDLNRCGEFVSNDDLHVCSKLLQKRFAIDATHKTIWLTLSSRKHKDAYKCSMSNNGFFPRLNIQLNSGYRKSYRLYFDTGRYLKMLFGEKTFYVSLEA